ncbi:fumarylacetoacetate hydrolase family protein [Paraburkholderia sp. J12]|uniref:fumarylacetoacetate hydrolase family protein n=1 Tax=Paraburkholderia sp. J12 TaxID=2805432 RepID=UPI002ABD8D5A|nr:fumarylacetoacetate hydrolase family protein [Paraburkholderia sp. J12]
MKLVTIDAGIAGAPGAILRSGEILHLARAALPGSLEAWLPGSLREILAAGEAGLAIVRQIVQRVEAMEHTPRERLRAAGTLTGAATPLLAPIPRPGLVLAAGLAYRSHLAEMAGTPAPPHPTGFLKSPHSIAAPDTPVILPPDADRQVDYEGELAVVFGRTCHGVTAQTALDYVGGYTVANDLSARDWVRAVWEAREPWQARTAWEVNIMGKQFDGFTPLGPALVTSDEIPDPALLQLTTRLNGEVMQQASVSDLIFDVAHTIAHFARWYTFEPGDVLLTGTPAGVGVGRKPPVFLRDGDVVDVTVTGIGHLRSTVCRA